MRLFGDGPSAVEATAAERDGLAAQIVAAEGAAAAGRAERSGRTARSPKGKRKLPARGGDGRGPAGKPAKPGPDTHRRPLASGPLDVDRATAAELEALPGIGPALAGRIVAARSARGPFGSLVALDEVPGIGPALIKRLAPHVTFSGPRRPSDANGSGGGARLSGRVVGLIGGTP